MAFDIQQATRFVSHYELLEPVGHGGMGVVYKARDTHLGRMVAIKLLPPGNAHSPESRRRFVGEAKAASALNHPNIITVYDADCADEVDFIAMEFVAGHTLDQIIGRKGLSLNDALRYAVQIADALSKAHAAGIVHRDLKPANIMVNADGLVKVLDFGLAKRVEPISPMDAPTMSFTDATREGKVVGTPAYMSPEQVERKPLDARTDVFSFGIVVYEMLTSERPFKGATALEVATSILRDEPPPPSRLRTVPAELDRVILRCLRKDPARRWQAMADLNVALQELKEESHSGALETVPSMPRRSPVAWPLIAAAVLLVIVAGALVQWKIRASKSAPRPYEATRLTFEPGVAAVPSISRDGKLLAFASDRTGSTDIYVQQINGRQATRVTNNGADNTEPSFSPDGTRLVFASSQSGGGIFLIDTLGGNERELVERGRLPRFSPDGSLIIYLVPAPFGLRARMFLISPDGGTPRPFQPEFSIPMVGPSWPPAMWSPDGKFILFRAVHNDNPESLRWWVAPVAGGDSQPLDPPSLSRTGIQAPQYWAGDFIYYFEGTTFGGVGVNRVRILRDPWRLGSPEKLSSGGVQVGLSVSDDHRLVFSWLSFLVSPWSLPFDGNRGIARGTAQRLVADTSGKLGLAVDRKGSKLAYTAMMVMPERRELRIRDLGTGHEDVIPLQFAALSAGAQFSPDGSHIAYRDQALPTQANRSGPTLTEKPGSSIYYLVPVAGGERRMICKACNVLGFLPDSAHVVVGEAKRLVRLRLADGMRWPLVETPAGVTEASVPPDGRHVAFITGNAEGDAILYVAPVTDPPALPPAWRQVTIERTLLLHPSWSPNGDLLYYVSARDGHGCLWAQRIAADGKPQGEPFAAFHSHQRPSLFLGAGQYVVTADRLFLSLGDTSGNVWTIKFDQE